MTFPHWTAGLDPVAALGLLLASFAGSFMTVAMGIGGGAFLLAIMASLMPPAALIPVHGVIQLGSNGLRAALFLNRAHWSTFGAFLGGSIVGAGLGGLIVVDLPVAWVQIGVGGFVLWSVLGRAPTAISQWPAITGVISSFLTMFFGATGVFVANYIRSLKMPKDEHVATHAVFMTLQHLLKIVVFGVLGFAFAPWLGFIAGMIVFGFLGTVLGRRVLFRINEDTFRRGLSAVLILLALRLIWQGLRSL